MDIQVDVPDGWTVIEPGDESDVYEPDRENEESGVRIVVPHLDAAILVQPLLVGRVFRERVWRVALQSKYELWETGEQYLYETQWEEWADSKRELTTTLDALIADLAAATALSDLHVIEGRGSKGE